MTYEEVRRLLSSHFNQMLERRKLQIAEHGRLTQLDTSTLESSLYLAQSAVADAGPLLPGGDDSETIARFVAKYDLSIQPGTAAYTHLSTDMKRAYRDYCAAVLDYDRSLDSYDFSSVGSAPSVVQTNATNTSQVSIRQLSDLYTNESNVGGQWVSKTRHEKADHISLLTEILGEHTDITAVSTTDARKVKDILLRYPRNRRKNPATRGLSLLDALHCEGVPTINVQTINKYLQTYGTMFSWAQRNSYVSTNVFEGLSVRQSKKQQSKTARTAFAEDEVQMILQQLLHNSRGLVLKPYQKWGPLVALYSGARLNEIAQIHLTDIRQQDGIWCFDLNDEGDTKNLKTDASRRCVPVHSRLIALGLLEHVQALRESGAQKLFQGFQYCPKNGWGRSLGRWFNDQFLVKLGLKDKGISFHVCRHTVITRLLHAGVDLEMVQTIVGHERQGVTHQHYFTSGYKISQLRDALEKLSFADPNIQLDTAQAGRGTASSGFR